MASANQHNVCVPMKVDAFSLNAAACNGPSLLAPISLPDYTHLRLDETLKHDVQEDVDLRNTALGAAFSERVTDLATGELKRNRLGIYLHWLLPRFYRTGLSVTQSSDGDAADLRNKRGYQPTDGAGSDPQSPTYRPLPTRWIVLRHLIAKTPQNANIPEFQAFVIESDRLQTMENLGSDVDIEVEVSPFVYMGGERDTLGHQAETFIGFKQPLEDWTESGDDEDIIRVPLSVLSSVNPLFVDYQPHNTNVFSMIDNFKYDDGGRVAYLQGAKANYYILGWHPEAENDPFHLFEQPAPYPIHKDRVDACLMALADSSSNDVTDWAKSVLSLDEPTKTIIHGAIYEVVWDLDAKPSVVPADTIAKSYDEFSPVSVGVNPVDALLAVTHTQSLNTDEHQTPSDDPDLRPDPLAQDILSLQTLVIKQEEDPDSQLDASDILYSSSFTPADAGQQWHVSGAATITADGKRPTVPGAQELQDLTKVNEYQNALDLCTREMKWLRWSIWAEWWKWITTHRERTNQEKQAVRDKVNSMVNSHAQLVIETQQWQRVMDAIIKKYNWETVTSPRYYSSKDPTILLCGVKSGWPVDFASPLNIRLDSQLISANDLYDPAPDGWEDIQRSFTAIAQKLPSDLQETAGALLTEFFVLRPVPTTTPHLRPSPADTLLYPLYHDRGPGASEPAAGEPVILRDQWNGTQAWFPLFAEWEIEYVHISAENWIPATREAYGSAKLYSTIRSDADISNITNRRTINGRSLILPQTGSSLKTTVGQLLRNKNTKPSDLDAINAALDRLDLLTLSANGVSGSLITTGRGSHVAPTMYQPGYGPQPLPEAVKATQGVIDQNAIRLMTETTMTPYGDFPDFRDVSHSPFKPAIHGQFLFKKLNLVDMFGQAISAIDPSPSVVPSLRPYISEYYACSVDKSSGQPIPRTVEADSAQCVQIGPYLNQDSRLNAYYVKWDTSNNMWVPVTEYDNPIWGWLVVNYIDNGLQVFLPDGSFYREIRLGGPEGTSDGITAWLPFKAPASDENIPPQLRALMQKLREADYLREFFEVMTGALDAVSYAPNQYSGYFPAITGKPFALVNTGWSLELSHPPHVNQSTSSPESAIAEPGLESYEFQIKMGDKDRTFDGLLGYFQEKTNTDLDLDHFYTYFPGSDTGVDQSLTVLIEPDNYPTLSPFFNSAISTDSGETIVKEPSEIHMEFNKQLKVFGMLVDPFTLIHGYSSFQPVQVLRLPQWALEQSLKNITAFFHMGPIIMPDDVPSYDPSRVLHSGSSLDNIPKPPDGTPAFPIPSVAVADWAWLQPYYNIDPTSAPEPDAFDNIAFNPFSLTALKEQPDFKPTPYTAVEGYLYLKTPITSPDVPPAQG